MPRITTDYIGPLLTNSASIKREAAKRRKPNEVVSVKKSLVEEHVNEGWEVEEELKLKTRLRRPRKIDEIVENKAWYLLYLLGYPEISSGRQFKIRIERKGAQPLEKQIDVFAKDDETVLVMECKSANKVVRKSLQKDIDEFSNLKKPIANAIKKHYGTDFKPKILWFFVTHNIVWSVPDKERAKGQNINILTERELRYFLEISEHLRSAARFQFLAEYLKNQKIPEMDGIKIPAVQGVLGGKKYYSFVSTPRQMLKIAFVNHRSLNDPDGAPTYQRLVKRTRLRQVSKFIHDGGFFPNNILLNFTDKCQFEKLSDDPSSAVKFGKLILPNKYRSAWIIDGQHRLYGYAPLDNKFLDQNIFVIAFEKLKQEEEANLFVQINSQQKPVPKTLLDDLEGELKWGSENPGERIGAIAARLIGLMNTDVGEPLYNRVTQQGIPPTETTCLTVPAIKDGIRRSRLVGSIFRRKEYEPGPLSGLTDQETLQRAHTVLNSYFSILESANPHQWRIGKSGQYCTNVAIQAHIMLLGSIIGYMESEKAINARECSESDLLSEIEEYLEPVTEWFANTTDIQVEAKFKVQFGAGGPREYYYRLCSLVQQTHNDFTPEGYEDWQQEQSEERTADADHKLKQLNILVHKTIFETLISIHGLKSYWDNGISDKRIKTRAYEKSLEDDPEVRLSLDNYLDFIEYKKVVESKSNWPVFKEYFNIPEPGEKGLSKNLKWMERVNELRRKPAHATEMRQYKLNEFEYIDFIYEEFVGRISDLESVDSAEGAIV
ncbi:MAG: DGQHR domain-containing protein [Verrucomicrobiota bacterium]